jgi:WD40 repeat protein
LASGGDDCSVRLSAVRPDDDKDRVLGKLQWPVLGLAFSARGNLLVAAGGSGTQREVIVWELPEGKERTVLRWTEKSARCDGFVLAVSSVGRTVAVRGLNDTQVRLWNLKAEEQRPAALAESSWWFSLDHPAYALLFSKDGERLVSAWCADGKEYVQMWDVANRRPYQGRSIGPAPGQDAAAAKPSVLPGGDPENRGFLGFGIEENLTTHGAAVRWLRSEGHLKWWTPGSLPYDHPILLAPLAKIAAFTALERFAQVATASGTDGKVTLRWIGEVDQSATATVHERDVRALAFSPSGIVLATGAADGIKLWSVRERDLSNVKRSVFIPARYTFGPTATPDKTKPPVNSDDVKPGREIPVQAARVRSLVFAADGKALAAGGEDGTVRLWHVCPDSWPDRVLGKLTYPVLGLAFSDDYQLLVAAGALGDKREVVVWDMPEGKERTVLRWAEKNVRCGWFALAVSPLGTTLALAAQNDPTIRVWDLTGSEQRPAVPTWRPSPNHPAYMLLFAEDGERLVSAWCDAEKERLEVWDLKKASVFRNTLRPGPPYAAWGVGGAPDKRGFLALIRDNEPKDIDFKIQWVSTEGGVQRWTPWGPDRLYGPSAASKCALGDVSAAAYLRSSGKVLVATTVPPPNGRVVLWWSDKSSIAPLIFAAHDQRVEVLALNPDGSLLATAANNVLRVWNVPRRAAFPDPKK